MLIFVKNIPKKTYLTLLIILCIAINAEADYWTQMASFPGQGRELPVSFSIGNKGYVGCGFDFLSYFNDFWEYDPALNSWSQKASFGGLGRFAAVGFSMNNKGYLGTGGDLNGNFYS